MIRKPAALVIFLPPFAAGLLLARFFREQAFCLGILPWLALLAAGVFFMAVPLFSGRSGPGMAGGWTGPGRPCKRRGATSLLALASIALFSAGALHMHLSIMRLSAQSVLLTRLAQTGERHIISAVVISAPLLKKGKLRFIAAPFRLHEPAGNRSLSGRLAVSVKSWHEAETPPPGSVVRFRARLRQVENFNTPGTFDYVNWWALRNILVKAHVPGPLAIITEKTTTGQFLTVPERILISVEKMRWLLMGFLRNGFADDQSRAVAAALLFGDGTGLSEGLRRDFAAAGAGHLLAVSGLHMAMAAFILYTLSRWLMGLNQWLLFRINTRKASLFISMPGVILYAALAGFSPSATRAAVMILIFSCAFLLDRPHDPLNSLAAAAWILLGISPLYLFDTAFQFSFCAVCFLILFAKIFRHRPAGQGVWKRLKCYMLDAAAATATAIAATTPLAAWHFQRISVAGPILNLLLVPATCFIILPLLLAGLLAAPISQAAAHLLWAPAAFFIHKMVDIVHFTASLPWSWHWISRPAIWQLTAFWLGLLAVATALSEKTSPGIRNKAAMLAIILFLAVPAGYLARKFVMESRRDMVFHLLDVGQGTSQVIELPEGRVMVMDTGGMAGDFDTGARIVGPFLRTLGYTRIDILAASHPETDHIGGMASVVRDFAPGEFWSNSDRNPGNPAWERLMQALKEAGTRQTNFNRGHCIRKAGTQFRIYTASNCSAARSRNARSLAIRAAGAHFSVLLTGDIDQKREACLVKNGLGHSDILVVPHHGSRSSSSPDFINAVNPEIALVSAGRKNRLGLPAPQVLEHYQKRGIRVFRTDMDGTVTVTCDPDRASGLAITTFKARPL